MRAAPSSTAAHSSSIGTGGPGVTRRLLAIATATGRPGTKPTAQPTNPVWPTSVVDRPASSIG